MRRRWAIGLAAVCALAVAAVAFWPEPKEPEYNGKKLSEWLHDEPLFVPIQGRQRAWMKTQSAEAVRHIGTNALPFLVKWIRYERPAWKDKASVAYKKLPRALVITSLDSWLTCGKAEMRADAAMACFQFLGQDAAPTVPELIGMLKVSKAPATSQRAVFCLGCIGPKARAALPYLRERTKGFPSGISLDATMAIHNIEPRDMGPRAF